MTEPIIRTAQVEDIENIIALVSETPSVLVPHAHSVYWGFIYFYPSMNVVAESDGKLIGWCGGVKPDEKTGFTWQIFVHEDYRRKGIAEAMVKKVFADNLEDDVRRILLAIDRNNKPSQELFGKVSNDMGLQMDRQEENEFLLGTYNEDLYEVS